MIKSMTPTEYTKVLDFLQKYHKFANYRDQEERDNIKKKYPKMSEYGLGIKYVDCCYDSREGRIWSVTFRLGGHSINFRSIFNNGLSILTGSYIKLPSDNLFDWIMMFLKGECEAKEFQFK